MSVRKGLAFTHDGTGIIGTGITEVKQRWRAKNTAPALVANESSFSATVTPHNENTKSARAKIRRRKESS